MKGEIRNELARARADSLALGRAKRIQRQIALAKTPAATAAATAAAGGIVTSAPFAASEQIPGLGMVPDLYPELDRLTVGRWATKPFKESNTYVLVRPTKRIPKAQAEFDEVKRQAVEET